MIDPISTAIEQQIKIKIQQRGFSAAGIRYTDAPGLGRITLGTQPVPKDEVFQAAERALSQEDLADFKFFSSQFEAPGFSLHSGDEVQPADAIMNWGHINHERSVTQLNQNRYVPVVFERKSLGGIVLEAGKAGVLLSKAYPKMAKMYAAVGVELRKSLCLFIDELRDTAAGISPHGNLDPVRVPNLDPLTMLRYDAYVIYKFLMAPSKYRYVVLAKHSDGYTFEGATSTMATFERDRHSWNLNPLPAHSPGFGQDLADAISKLQTSLLEGHWRDGDAGYYPETYHADTPAKCVCLAKHMGFAIDPNDLPKATVEHAGSDWMPTTYTLPGSLMLFQSGGMLAIGGDHLVDGGKALAGSEYVCFDSCGKVVAIEGGLVNKPKGTCYLHGGDQAGAQMLWSFLHDVIARGGAFKPLGLAARWSEVERELFGDI